VAAVAGIASVVEDIRLVDRTGPVVDRTGPVVDRIRPADKNAVAKHHYKSYEQTFSLVLSAMRLRRPEG